PRTAARQLHRLPPPRRHPAGPAVDSLRPSYFQLLTLLMCSRFILKLGDAINLSKRLGIPLAQLGDTRDRYNVAPATGITAFRRTGDDATAATAAILHWGL